MSCFYIVFYFAPPDPLYFLAEIGKLCSDTGEDNVDDEYECRTATIGSGFNSVRNFNVKPPGCYLTPNNKRLFNTHPTGKKPSASDSVQHICKKGHYINKMCNFICF